YPKSFKETLKPEIALCIGPLQYNYAQGLRIVEFFEIYKLLGITKFYVYYLSSSNEVKQIIEYYEKQGLIDVLDWELEGYHFENNFRYGGIFSALNECVYRSRIVDSFKYAAIIDFDEVLMPFKNDSLPKFIESLGDHSEYIFSNTFFHKFMKEDDSSTPDDAVNRFLYTQSRIERTQVYIKTSRTKYVVKTEEAIEIGNHHMWRTVSSDTDSLVRNEDIEERNIDFSARRFGTKIWKNVDKVCGAIFENGKCPL
uniref:Glycosyltransferase family 92 protein n=1 Tax=Megaselia scalaris TaxID=36166 RepID=T1H5B6_MEGSC